MIDRLYECNTLTILDWVEEHMAPLVESMEPKKQRTYEDVLCDAQEEASDLSWIHYLGWSSRFLIILENLVLRKQLLKR